MTRLGSTLINKLAARSRVAGCAVVVLALLVSACGGASVEKAEKSDSLFLGFTLGMKRQEFFDHCWEYNRKKLFTHGPTNREVEYKLKDVVNGSVSMRFYPSFYNDRIYEMPVTYNYDAWAPWNRQYKSDTLIKHLVPVFEKWYGRLQVTHHPKMGTVYYRIDGKRRINIYIKDDQFVRVVFTDLKVEKELNEVAREGGE